MDVVQTKSASPLNVPYFVGEDGALNFRSVDDYFALSDSLAMLSDKEYMSWEEKNNFNSYRTYVQNIIDNLENVEINNYDDIIAQNSEYVYKDKYGSISPIIDAHVYQCVANKERFFYVNSVKHIVNRDYINVEYSSKSKENEIIDYSLKSNSRNTVEYPEIEYQRDRSQYKLFTWFKIYKNTITSGPSKGEKICMDVCVRPRKFNQISGWKGYNDYCMVEELTIHLEGLGMTNYFDENGRMVFGNDQMMYLPTVTSSEKTSLFTSTYILSGSMGGSVPERIKDPICVHYRARTGETGKYGGAYNTYHPNPGMDPNTCGHRIVTEYQHVVY